MKVTVKEAKESKEKEQVYPFIGEHENGQGLTILFTAEKEGVVLRSGSNNQRLGHTYNEYVMSLFTPFKGKLILSND